MRHRFRYKPYRLPFRFPWRTAHGERREREGIYIRLEDENGRAGFGEIAPLDEFGTESTAEAAEICRALGDSPDDAQIEAVPLRFGCVRFALTASRTVAAPANTTARLPVAALLPAGRAALEVLPDKLEAGFLCCKWKVGVGRAEEEFGILDDLLSRLPDYVRLRLDANGAWDRRTAERWLARCAERPIEFVEQPVAAGNHDLLLGLAHDFPVKLALDESVVHLQAAREWQARGWPGIFVLKPALAGPLAELIDWARTTKPDLVLSSSLETALARAQIIHAVLAHDLTTRALGFGVGDIFGDRRWDGPFLGTLVDTGWVNAVNPEELWNAMN